MKLLCRLVAFLILFAPFAAGGSIRVEKIEYHGWPNSYRIANDTIQVIVLADVGPRIIFYGLLNGENEFHEFHDQAGTTGGTEYRSYGGHRLWVSPEVKRTYFPDNVPVRVSRRDDAMVFTAPVENVSPGIRLQKEMEIQLSPHGSHVTIIHRIRNLGGSSTALAPWSLSVMEQNGRAILPLPPRAAPDSQHLLPEGCSRFGPIPISRTHVGSWERSTCS